LPQDFEQWRRPLLRQVMPFNVMSVGGSSSANACSDGQRLYADILETNPPMAVSVYLHSALRWRAIGVRPGGDRCPDLL
jgi:hypothetical protein